MNSLNKSLQTLMKLNKYKFIFKQYHLWQIGIQGSKNLIDYSSQSNFIQKRVSNGIDLWKLSFL